MLVPLTPLDFKRRAVKLFPNKVGVVDGEKRFTYREFGERADRLANALKELGVQKGDTVSFICLNQHQLLEAYYGVVEAGGILNPINVRLSPQEIAYILNHSRAKVLFFHDMFFPLISQIKDNLDTVLHYVVIEGEPQDFVEHEYEGLLAEASPEEPELWFDENDPAELFYTSGTTGFPKGAILTHRTLYLHGLYFIIGINLTDADRILHIVPLFHVNGWGTPQALTAVGGTHIMLRKIDPAIMLDLIQREKVTLMFGVPTIFNALVNYPDLDKYDLSSVRAVILGGAPSPLSLIKAVEEKFKTLCFVGYGLTETSPVLTLARPKAHLADEPYEKRLERQAKTGYEILGVEVRVVNDKGEDVKPDGQEIGEIIARSNVVMDGYYRDPKATAEAIKDGWFYTGDMATIDEEGYVLIVDRKKDIIISGGENIASVEIEKVLYAHPAVYECAVIAVPDEKWGEVPKALVVLKPGMTATEEELIQHCRQHLAGFKIPKSVDFFDSLPKGGTGKILKRELRERYWKGYEKRVH